MYRLRRRGLPLLVWLSACVWICLSKCIFFCHPAMTTVGGRLNSRRRFITSFIPAHFLFSPAQSLDAHFDAVFSFYFECALHSRLRDRARSETASGNVLGSLGLGWSSSPLARDARVCVCLWTTHPPLWGGVESPLFGDAKLCPPVWLAGCIAKTSGRRYRTTVGWSPNVQMNLDKRTESTLSMGLVTLTRAHHRFLK